MKRNERNFNNDRYNNNNNEKKVKLEFEKSDNEIINLFQNYSKILDEDNDRRERIVKVSRDITIASKRLISLLHRVVFEDRNTILTQAHQDLVKVNALIGNIIKELEGQEYWKFQKSFTWGLQEYTEAISFLYFIETGQLVPVDYIHDKIKESNNIDSLSTFSLSVDDYHLGLCDLVGELMRYCTNSVTKQKYQDCFDCCEFVRTIFTACKQIRQFRPNDSKMSMIDDSVKKIEKICFSIRIRTSEFPDKQLKITADPDMEV
ncbi:hypothetical protein DLAC_04563 [Tieghemostelium lacteum]|uniref:Translin family protein n=1 Tax=Tieghemostelium lacteum TaxID=361077 RepID=A0A151ZJV8_TIELA|nr:hypothetical protein DLAC_04563 [Tieghemostelium lacteum]|eukprot:KYQ94263.1 hypothetical protein DLAC_04563 [Tieghemostelium lacteum]